MRVRDFTRFSGSTITAASPATSGQLVRFEQTTGAPHCIASRIGRPNPSYRDRKRKAAQPA